MVYGRVAEERIQLNDDCDAATIVGLTMYLDVRSTTELDLRLTLQDSIGQEIAEPTCHVGLESDLCLTCALVPRSLRVEHGQVFCGISANPVQGFHQTHPFTSAPTRDFAAADGERNTSRPILYATPPPSEDTTVRDTFRPLYSLV